MPTKSDLLKTIKSSVVSRLSRSAALSTNLFIESRVLKQGEDIVSYKKKIPIDRETIMVFADEAPRYNWAHPCRYLLHDAKTGQLYKDIRAQFPPYMTKTSGTYTVFHEPVRLTVAEAIFPILPRLRCPIRWIKGRRYAVLFAGAANNRHTNDLEYLYRTLLDIYGLNEADIFVLNYDGTINYNGNPKPVTSWPGDNSAYRMKVNGQGTKNDLDGVLDTLKTKLKTDDLLLIHTNNHGGHNGTESYLCTYSGADYLASDFAAKLSALPKFYCLMVMMEQCHSGGFNTPILSQSPATNTSISSACEELKSSIGGSEFDPFARDWISAMTGNTPYGGVLASNPDVDSSGKVSAHEAHDYAVSIKDPYDTPVYNESSTDAGDCYLGVRYSYYSPVLCRLLVKYLKPYYVKILLPEFYRKIHEKLIPQLKPFETSPERWAKQEDKLAKEVNNIIIKVFGR